MHKYAKTNYLKGLVQKLWSYKVVRFFIVGCFNTIFDITLLLIFYRLANLSEVLANTMSVTIAISVSYFLNHRVVFQQHQKYSLKNYLRFFVITGIGIICIQDLIIYFVTQKLWIISDARIVSTLHHQLRLKTIEVLGAKLAGGAIGMVWNFLLYRYIIFPHSARPDEAEELAVL